MGAASLAACADPLTDDILNETDRVFSFAFLREAKVKSNTQVVLPGNLFLGDINGDGIDDFIQVSGTPGAGNQNRILVFGTDRASTGMMHLYLDTDVVKVFTGNFQLSTEPNYGPDQLCVITASNQRNCYMSTDQKTLTLMWSQANLVDPGEDIIVGDFDGNGADDLVLYNAAAGTFRMATRTTGSTVSNSFYLMPEFAPGDLANGQFVNYHVRAGQFGPVPGTDTLILCNPVNGQVALYGLATGNPVHPQVHSFATILTSTTNAPSSGAETLSTGRVVDGPGRQSRAQKQIHGRLPFLQSGEFECATYRGDRRTQPDGM